MTLAIAAYDPEECLSRIAKGELTKNIAAELGMSKEGLRDRLKALPGYTKSIQDQAESLVENQLDEVLSVPPDKTLIARARVRFEAAKDWAAARDPATWAPRPANITINNNVLSISDSLVGQAGELLSQLRVCNTVPAIASQQIVDNDQE